MSSLFWNDNVQTNINLDDIWQDFVTWKWCIINLMVGCLVTTLTCSQATSGHLCLLIVYCSVWWRDVVVVMVVVTWMWWSTWSTWSVSVSTMFANVSQPSSSAPVVTLYAFVIRTTKSCSCWCSDSSRRNFRWLSLVTVRVWYLGKSNRKWNNVIITVNVLIINTWIRKSIMINVTVSLYPRDIY